MEPCSKICPAYKVVNGLRVCVAFDDDYILEAQKFFPRDDDLLIATYPKCGTTWTQQIVTLLLNHGQPYEDFQDFRLRNPFIELLGVDQVKKMPRPGMIKTHMPFDMINFNPKAKYIYVARNPKDACVSFFHHTRGIGGYMFSKGDFETYFELFINGQVDYNDYFDHLLSWWSQRSNSNVLFLTFEYMKSDIRSTIKTIAKFFGEQYMKEIEEDPTLIDNIIKYSSFDYMKARNKSTMVAFAKENPIDTSDPSVQKFRRVLHNLSASGDGPKRDHEHFRKGVVNDWKNIMSSEQAERLNERFLQKVSGTGIEKLWNQKDWL